MLAKYQKFILPILLIVFFYLLPSLTLANDMLDKLRNAGGPAGAGYNPTTSSDSLSLLIANIIQVLLGFLGIIFLILIIYGGYLWMTAAGSEDKIKKSKQILINATIGLAIVLAAYAITWFVFEYLRTASGGVGGGGIPYNP